MADFNAFPPKVEVLGAIVCTFVDAMGAFKGLAVEILDEHGVHDPQPMQWYPQKAWRGSLDAIAKKIGPNTLFQIARQIPSGAAIPADVDTLAKAFESLDTAYRGTHRGGECGHYLVIENSERHLKVECSTPYPCDFDRGVVAGLAHRFEGENPLLDIHHDTYAPCKKEGAVVCVFSVSW